MKDLIYLAKSKGFVDNLGFKDVDDLLTTSSKWEYLWISLLKRWLEDTHELYVTVNPIAVNGREFYFHVDKWMGTELGFQNQESGFEDKYFKTSFECLKSGVEIALNQIEC